MFPLFLIFFIFLLLVLLLLLIFLWLLLDGIWFCDRVGLHFIDVAQAHLVFVTFGSGEVVVVVIAGSVNEALIVVLEVFQLSNFLIFVVKEVIFDFDAPFLGTF